MELTSPELRSWTLLSQTCSEVSIVTIGNMCYIYLLGGISGGNVKVAILCELR